jgi:hypothetical protein
VCVVPIRRPRLEVGFDRSDTVVFLTCVTSYSALVGMGAMVSLFPVPGYFAKKMQSVQELKMKMVCSGAPLDLPDLTSDTQTDARVTTVTETMNVIRMIKLFGWETKMNNRLDEKRQEELKVQRKRQYLELTNNIVK